jgi:hypothetical protein
MKEGAGPVSSQAPPAGRVRQRGRFMASMLEAPQRWAAIVATVVFSDHDPAGLEDWAYLCHLQVRTIRQTCALVGVRPKHSLEFARLLRVTRLCGRRGARPCDLLAMHDLRTLRKFAEGAGIDVYSSNVLSVIEVINRQSFIEPKVLRQAILSQLELEKDSRATSQLG